MRKDWTINCLKKKDEIFFTIRWSPWGSMDKWVISRIVPSESGLFQLWERRGGTMHLLITELAYYGGLRHNLREAIDSSVPAGSHLRKIMEGKEVWFRFSLSMSREHLILLKAWHSGSGKMWNNMGQAIMVNEVDTEKIFPLPPPDIQMVERKRMEDADFGHPQPGSRRI